MNPRNEGYEYTAELARRHELPPKAKDETATAFRQRISGLLRDAGHIIEAHEAYQNDFYDSPASGGAMNGILGSVAMAMQGVDYGSSGRARVEDERVAGLYTKTKKPDDPNYMAALLMAMFMKSR